MTTRTLPATPTTHGAANPRFGVVIGGALHDQQRSLVAWSAAVAAVTTLYSSFYPTMSTTQFELMLDSLPDFARAMGFEAMVSAAGYVGMTVYSLLGALLTLICAITAGARLIAGDEEAGVLELDLGAPVTRTRVFVERLVVVWVMVLVLVTVISATLLILTGAFDLDLSVANVIAASTGLAVFTGTMGTLAFAVGAATGRRAYGIGAGAAVAVTGYLFNYLSPLIDAPWMETVSPFSWYIAERPLTNGFDWGGIALLAVLAAAAAAGGWWRFRRRDLMV